MTGRNDIEAAFAHMYSDQLTDFFDEYGRIAMIATTTNNTSVFNDFLNQTLPRNMKFFEDRLSRNRGFLAGSGFTYADLHLGSILDLMNEQKSMVLKAYPNIAALDRRVLQIPQIADWIKKRPKTDM
jgi:glutathione S-transferase